MVSLRSRYSSCAGTGTGTGTGTGRTIVASKNRYGPDEADLVRDRLAVALSRTGTGDAQAFRLVYELTSAKLFGICLRICGDRAAAEDVLADTYVSIWKHAGTWQPGRASPISWLSAIARNRSVDWLRSARRRSAASLEGVEHVADPAVSIEATLLNSENYAQLHKRLDGLGEMEDWAIRAAFFDGFTYAELAEMRGIPLGTMKSRIRRALARMKCDLSINDMLPTA